MNTPLAVISCRRGTSCGIIDASAGAKNTVTVEIITLTSSRISRKSPAIHRMTNSAARITLVATRTMRRSNRST